MTTQNNTHEEIDLDFPEVNRNLIEAASEGIARHSTNYRAALNDFQQNADNTSFQKLQHQLLDAFPAILNTQIRDLFTPAGRSKGRFRLRQLSEVYNTMAQLFSAIALADLWKVAANTSRADKPLKYTAKQSTAIKNFIFRTDKEAEQKDHFGLLRIICNVFQKNKVKPFLPELLEINERLDKDAVFTEAYLFFENELPLRLATDEVADDDVLELCKQTENQLGVLLQASGFLVNYEILRIKDITVDKVNKNEAPAFVHDKMLITGREFPAVDHQPMAYTTSYDHHAVFLTRNATEDGLSLNLSPFVIDRNVYRGKKSYLPKIYFFDGKNEEDTVYFNHVDTPEFNFELTHEPAAIQSLFSRKVYTDLQSFCEDFGIS